MRSILSAQAITRLVTTVDGNLTILDQLSLELKLGESLAIQGASGSGKSTLLAVLAGLDKPQKGKVIMNGQNITELDEDQRALLRADNVGFVFQSFYLIEDLTALENVALPLELFGHAAATKSAKGWLEKLGMADRMHHFPRQLSGGEQQRVALCRAFSIKPAILFADEPTANLDQKTAELVLEQLFSLQREFNTSMLIVTHDRTLAKRCDRKLFIKSGALVSDQ